MKKHEFVCHSKVEESCQPEQNLVSIAAQIYTFLSSLVLSWK